MMENVRVGWIESSTVGSQGFRLSSKVKSVKLRMKRWRLDKRNSATSFKSLEDNLGRVEDSAAVARWTEYLRDQRLRIISEMWSWNQQVDSSMPRASKKQKGKGVSSNGSNNGVRHSGYVGRLEQNLGRAILSERNINLNNLIESDVPQQVIFMSSSMKPSRQITITVYELAKLLYCIKHQERLDVGKIIRRAIIRAESVANLVLPFPALIIYFCEQAGLQPEERDRLAQMDGPLNSRTFNDISAQRNEVGLRPVATRKRQRKDAIAHAAEEAAEEDPGAVPTGDHRTNWVDEILRKRDWVDTLL
ncbi:hypothetical protein LWI29_010390 [Acer saccharum]|uniref:Uncharacterized protein n=1 Tax=Acer saccharum TaxID=4024 RepID=A0AA39SUJ6_ACESA|nr:hypothetical protein LWI29_010390 [Acer saccharum]